MNNFSKLIEFGNDTIKKYPQLKEDILDLIELCKANIEEGDSEMNEVALCYTDINELIKNEE
jgi:hypothetical protein